MPLPRALGLERGGSPPDKSAWAAVTTGNVWRRAPGGWRLGSARDTKHWQPGCGWPCKLGFSCSRGLASAAAPQRSGPHPQPQGFASTNCYFCCIVFRSQEAHQSIKINKRRACQHRACSTGTRLVRQDLLFGEPACALTTHTLTATLSSDTRRARTSKDNFPHQYLSCRVQGLAAKHPTPNTPQHLRNDEVTNHQTPTTPLLGPLVGTQPNSVLTESYTQRLL